MSDRPIVVVGSVVRDRTYRVPTLPLPGESTVADEILLSHGGKGANQAVASARLGAPTVFVGRVGADEDGRAAEEELSRHGVEPRLQTTTDAPTGQAAVVVDESGENQIAVHLGANLQLTPEDVEGARDEIRAASVLITQLEVPPETVRAAASLAGEGEAIRILNAAPYQEGAAELFSAFDLVVLNRGEAEQTAGVGIATLDDALAALRAVRGLGAPDAVVTLGPAGAVYLDQGRTAHAKAPSVEAVDATGAGDAFVGALAAFLRERLEMRDAVSRACHYAALAVTAAGARAGYADRTTLTAALPPED